MALARYKYDSQTTPRDAFIPDLSVACLTKLGYCKQEAHMLLTEWNSIRNEPKRLYNHWRPVPGRPYLP